MVVDVCDTHESAPNIFDIKGPFMTINYAFLNTNTITNESVFTIQPFIICKITIQHS
jgi:hypothetical protein